MDARWEKGSNARKGNGSHTACFQIPALIPIATLSYLKFFKLFSEGLVNNNEEMAACGGETI